MPVDADTLRHAVRSVPLAVLEREIFYRSVDYRAVRLQRLDILDGTRAGVRGGRYNEPGSNPTTYLARSQTLASLECERDLLDLGLDSQPKNPRLICSVVVGGARILDLTDDSVLDRLGVDRQDLVVPSEVWQMQNAARRPAVSQIVGTAARSLDTVDGILAPSWFVSILGGTLPRMENLVLFMRPVDGARHRNRDVRVTVHDPDGLLGWR